MGTTSTDVYRKVSLAHGRRRLKGDDWLHERTLECDAKIVGVTHMVHAYHMRIRLLAFLSIPHQGARSHADQLRSNCVVLVFVVFKFNLEVNKKDNAKHN